MSYFSRLDAMLRNQDFIDVADGNKEVVNYAKAFAVVENAVVVLSDLRNGVSLIFSGAFGMRMGLRQTGRVDSIWEEEVLKLMDEKECEAKYLAELRFFNYIHRVPKSQRKNLFLATRLRMRCVDGRLTDVLHRMHYVYDNRNANVDFAICIYSPLIFGFVGKSMVVNSVTGGREELTPAGDSRILSARELQVLNLIETGRTSEEIAGILAISKHTVSRHRQAIIAKLRVKNSVDACRVAKSLGII